MIFYTERLSQLGLARYLPESSRLSPAEIRSEDVGFGTAVMSEPVSEVGWDKCLLSEAPTLFTNGLGPCIAVLAKSTHPQEAKTYYGITHIFSEKGLGVFSSMLDQMGKKTHHAAITLFINGGRPSSRPKYAELLRMIKEREERINIVQDLFSIMKHQFSVSTGVSKFDLFVQISQTGFQDDGAPYVIYDCEVECYEGQLSKLKVTD